MIPRVLYAMIAAFVLFAAGAYLLPDRAHVERSIEIGRPVGTVFTVLDRFDAFPAWSPWFERDPDMAYRFTGPVAGAGARLEWSGDPRQVGTGWMQIIESRPNSLVRSRLVLELQGQADTAFHIDRIAGGTRVTWTFDADLVEGQGWFGSLLSRYFGLFFDRWIGNDFETGLDGLKNWVEALPGADFTGLEADLVEVDSVDVLFVPDISGQNGNTVADELAAAYRAISSFMAMNGIERAGQPMAVARAWDEKNFRFSAAIPATRTKTPAEDPVQWGASPSGWAARAVHHGSYDDLPATYEKLAAWMAAHGHSEGKVTWEHYISDPAETAVEDLVTHVYFQLGSPPRG